MPNDPALDQVAAEIETILARPTRAKEEGKILALLRALTPESFAATIDRLDVERLMNALDNRVWGPDSRKEFLRLLPPALGFLAVESKAAIVTSLARGPTSHSEERSIKAIFMSESGERLTRLKLDVDAARDGHDLLSILYDDIDAADIRFDLIQHFQRDTEQRDGSAGLRVVSDIDDTLYSSLNDARFKRGTIYPGVLELFSQLSPHPPVFLTARPEFAASLFERLTHKQLQRYGLEGCTVLSGNIPGLFGHQRMADQKARTLVQYRELYPEFRFIFIGDSGQGDLALATNLLTRSPEAIERALIHRLSDTHLASGSGHGKIHLFENYAEAATILAEHGYLSPQQAEIVKATLNG